MLKYVISRVAPNGDARTAMAAALSRKTTLYLLGHGDNKHGHTIGAPPRGIHVWSERLSIHTGKHDMRFGDETERNEKIKTL